MKLQSDPRRLVVPLAVSLLTGGGSATAASYTYDGYGVTNEQNIHVLSPRDIAGGSRQIVLTGSGAYAGVNLPAWCLDIYNYLATSGSYQVGVLTTAGSGGANPALSSTQIGALMAHGMGLINTSSDVSAAVQLAIWKVEYGSGFAFSGRSPGAIKDAQQYVDNVTGGTWGPNNNVLLLTQPNNQSLGALSPAPLPSTWTMMLAGLLGLGFFGWKMKYPSRAVAAA
jgi:hypothetical protein